MIRYQPLSSAEFKARRQKLLEQVPPNSLVILVSSDLFPANADAFHRYIPDSNFYYLTGLDQPEAIFCVLKSEHFWAETLFIPESNPHTRLWEGEKHSIESATTYSGCKQVHYLGAWKNFLAAQLPHAQQVFLNLPHHPRSVSTAAERWAMEIERMIQKPVDSISYGISELRTYKSNDEIKALKKAIHITKEAFLATAPKVRSMEFEYQLEAELTYHFLRYGAEGHAFEPIIAGGKNACTLHYTTNHDHLHQNELVLLDFGANWGHYKADITRVLPVSGRFSKRQKEIYLAVHQVLNQCKKSLALGQSLVEWKELANQYMQEALLSIGLISNKNKESMARETKKWFPHSIGHHLGLDVHDPCPANLPVQEGMVLTCEPGIYIPEENIGIRLETDLYVTAHGIVDLGEEIPIHWEAIEELINH